MDGLQGIFRPGVMKGPDRFMMHQEHNCLGIMSPMASSGAISTFTMFFNCRLVYSDPYLDFNKANGTESYFVNQRLEEHLRDLYHSLGRCY